VSANANLVNTPLYIPDYSLTQIANIPVQKYHVEYQIQLEKQTFVKMETFKTTNMTLFTHG
jgi:hypothetical protein